MLASLTAQAEVVMVSGTVYDVGKGAYSEASGVPGGDNLLCWAATASNLLQHWQDEYLTNTTGIPDGYANTVYTNPSGTRYLNIYNAISANVANTRNDLNAAITWYGNGTMKWDDTAQDYVLASGGYLREYGLQAKQWVWSTGYSNSFHSMAEFKGLLDTAFQYNGYGVFLSMEVDHNPNSGHAITCWGYETDKSGNNVTALYITDSDDHQFGARRVEVTLAADGGISFSSPYGNYSGSGVNYISGVSYITSVRAKNARTDNTLLPEDGVLTGAVDISGQDISSDTGLTAKAGSILAASGEDRTTLTLGPDAGKAAGNGLTVNAGAMLALSHADVAVTRFAGNGLSVAAEANLMDGTVSLTGNAGDGACVQGALTDTRTYLQMSGNTVVDISDNGGNGLYVEGVMHMDGNGSVTLAGNTGAGMAVKGSAAAFSNNTIGRSELVVSGNTRLEISGNKQGGVLVESSTSGGSLYDGVATFSRNNSILISGNEAATGAGACTEGQLTFSNNPELVFQDNKATANGGALASLWDWNTGEKGKAAISGNTAVSFKGNEAVGHGGAVYSDSIISISNNSGTVLFDHNTAGGEGGAMYVDGRGTLAVDGNTAVTISGNKAVNGSAVVATTALSGGYATNGVGGAFSMKDNGEVTITGNVSSGADVLLNRGNSFAISGNGAVVISGNDAGSGAVIHNAGVNVRKVGTNSYYPGIANPVLEIAHNGSVEFSGNKAAYDIFNQNTAYISADAGQTITFQHGIKNDGKDTYNNPNGGTTYIGKDASGATSSEGTYVLADGGVSLTLQGAVATVGSGGGILLADGQFSISETVFTAGSLVVDFGYYASGSTLTMTNVTLATGSSLSLMMELDAAAALVFSGDDSSLTETTITLGDYLTLSGTELAGVDLTLTVAGTLPDGTALVIDTCNLMADEKVTVTGYELERKADGKLYYKTIPEPATATLSLLALAALAARRRRKH